MAARDSGWPQSDYLTICYRHLDSITKKTKSGPKFSIGTKWRYVEYFSLAPFSVPLDGRRESGSEHVIETARGHLWEKIDINQIRQFWENRFWKSTFCGNGQKFKIGFVRIVDFNVFSNFLKRWLEVIHTIIFYNCTPWEIFGHTILGPRESVEHAAILYNERFSDHLITRYTGIRNPYRAVSPFCPASYK